MPRHSLSLVGLAVLLLQLLVSAAHAEEKPSHLYLEKEVLPQLRGKFSIHSVEELQRRIQAIDPLAGKRSEGWLIAHLADRPTVLKHSQAMLARDPADLEAVMTTIQIQRALGQEKEALEMIERFSGKDLQMRDERAAPNASVGHLDTEKGYMLLWQGRYEEAAAACKLGLERGALGQGNLCLGKVYLALGRYMEAMNYIRAAIATQRLSHGHFQYAYGIAASKLNDPRTAEFFWRQSLKSDPDFGPPLLALYGGETRPIELLKAEERADRSTWAEELAKCGIYYLELGMRPRAETCFSAADAVEPGWADAYRLLYVAEQKPSQALRKLEKLAKKQSHPAVLLAIADLHLQAGRYREARPWVEQVLAAQPFHLRAHRSLIKVCEGLQDAPCVQQYTDRLAPMKPRAPEAKPPTAPAKP